MPYDLDADHAWFMLNLKELYRQYPRKFLAVREKKVLGAYDDDWKAIESTPLPLGEYLLKPCLESPDAYTVHIRSFGAVLT